MKIKHHLLPDIGIPGLRSLLLVSEVCEDNQRKEARQAASAVNSMNLFEP